MFNYYNYRKIVENAVFRFFKIFNLHPWILFFTFLSITDMGFMKHFKIKFEGQSNQMFKFPTELHVLSFVKKYS